MINDLLVLLASIFGAFIASVAGGYGLITVPLLIFLGLPPHIALGSTNVGGLGYSLGNIFKFWQHKNLGVPWKDVLVLTVIAVPATFLGAKLVVEIDSHVLEKLTGIILLVLLPLVFVNKELGVKEKRTIGTQRIFAHVCFFLSRVWTGFFSPGAGLIETYVKMKAYGYTILQGKAVTRIPHIVANLAGVFVFISSGFVHWRYSIIMFIGMLIGGYFGMGYAIQKGDSWVKPIIGIVILITGIKLIFFS